MYHRFFLTLLLVLMLPAAVVAQSLDEAARQAVSQHNAKILSARTVQEGQNRVHVIKLLTRDGVVKTVRINVPEQKRGRNQKRDRSK